MIDSPLSAKSLEWACRRIEDFYTVWKEGEPDEAVEAQRVLRRSLGVSDAVIDDYHSWCRNYFEGMEFEGPMTLGLMIGLIAADHQNGT